MSAQPCLWEDGALRGIDVSGWSIVTCKKPILAAKEIDEATDKLSIPLPEITFGNNYVSLSRKGKQPQFGLSSRDNDADTDIAFKTLDALAEVDPTGKDNIKVAYADKWASSRNLEGSGETIIETVKNFDWTYSTSYTGTTGPSLSFSRAPDGHMGIPLHKLARQDEPILFYDDVTLFEDELHDNGIANLNVKIRVMPSCFFVLCRFFLRVDHVLFRIFDVRLYHEFGSQVIIRETKGKQATYDAVKSRLPREQAEDLTPLTDPNWVATNLGMLEQTSSELPAGGGAAISVSPTSSRRAVAAGISVPVRHPVVAQFDSDTKANERAMPSGQTLPSWTALGTHVYLASV